MRIPHGLDWIVVVIACAFLFSVMWLLGREAVRLFHEWLDDWTDQRHAQEVRDCHADVEVRRVRRTPIVEKKAPATASDGPRATTTRRNP